MRTAAMMQQPLATQRASFPRTPDTHDCANRSYVTTEVPECMVGMKCIRTANDDKTAEATDLGFLCFHVDMRAVVNVLCAIDGPHPFQTSWRQSSLIGTSRL